MAQSGRYTDALLPASAALDIQEKLAPAGDEKTCRILSELAAIHASLGDNSGAEPFYARALGIRQTLFPNSPATAMSMNDLAALYLVLGRYGEAKPLFESALSLREKAFGETNLLTAGVLNNLAVLQVMMGDNAGAQRLGDQALKIFERFGEQDSPELASGLNNLAGIFEMTGSNALAGPLYERALQIREKVPGPNHPDTAAVLDNLGAWYVSEGRLAQAESLLQRALSINEKVLGPDHPRVAAVLNDLGELYLKMNRLTNSEPLLWRALGIAEQSQALPLINRVGYNLRVLLARQGRREAAIFVGKQTVNNIQWMRGKQLTLNRQLQDSFLRIHGDYYRGLAALLVDAGRFPEAQQVLNMLKEEEYFEFIRRDADAAKDLTTAATLTAAEVQDQKVYAGIQSNIVALAKIRYDLKIASQRRPLTSEEQARLQEIPKEMTEASRAFKLVLDGISEEAPVRSQANPDYLADLKALQPTLRALGPGTVLLNYIVTPKRLYVLLTTPDIQVAGTTNLDEQALRNYIWDFRNVLMHPDRDPLPLAQTLYRILFGPVEEYLRQAGAKTLMVSLDGALRYLPVAALHDGRQYVLENYCITQFTEASRDKLKDPPVQSWRLAALGLSRRVGDFNALPYVREELTGIVQTDSRGAGVLPGIIRMDDQFTESEFADDLTSSNTVVHIASHFVFHPGTAVRSYLLLGDGSQLSIQEMKDKELRFDQLDLLTLSACETGVSEQEHGDGGELEGFATVAQRQGAKAILATLWPVADASTCQFMKKFYSQHKIGSISNKAEALQSAQLELLKGFPSIPAEMLAQLEPRGQALNATNHTAGAIFAPDPKAPYAHPYFWAPFILIGNWR